MTRPSTLARWCAAVATALLLAACGGGGGDDAQPTPTPTPVISVAGGGTAASTDGQLSLVVDPNTASAAGTPVIAKVAPAAEVAADGSYVPDSSYQYTGPDLNFSAPAAWVLNSTSATGAALPRPLAGGRRGILNAADATLTPVCDRLYAQQHGIEAKSMYVHDTCPSGCEKVWSNANDTLSRCAPRDPYFYVVPIAQSCVAGSTDVSATPGFPFTDTLRYCEFGGGGAQPSIGISTNSPSGPCVISAGKFVCSVKGLNNGAVQSIFEDTTPPAFAGVSVPVATGDPDVNRTPGELGGTVVVPPGGSHPFTLTMFANGAAEPVGLSQFDLREITSFGLVNGSIDMSSTVLWSAVPQGQSLPSGTKTYSVEVPLTYTSSDPPQRYFYARAIDWAGNIRVSTVIRVARVSPTGPVIATFTATPSQLPTAGGNATLAWTVTGATSASIDNGVGSVNATSGSVSVPVSASTTFTLTATNAVGSVTQTASVIVAPDTVAPTVTMSASQLNVVAPGSTTLTATASDAVGVTKVEFYEGATLLATKTAPPYTHDIAYTSANVGAHSYTAKAHDAANNIGTSTAVAVQVSLPSSADRFVSNATGNDGNDGLSASTAYKTVTKALTSVGSGGTVWLASGSYPPENAGLPNPGYLATVPAGITVRASTDGGASLGFGLSYAAGGSAIGLVFNGPSARSAVTGIDATGGTVTLSRLVFTNLGNAANAAAAVKVRGTAVATLDAGPGNPITFGTGVENSVLASEGGKLTVLGGQVQTLGTCSSDICARVTVSQTAEVVFDGTGFSMDNSGEPLPQPVFVLSGSGKATVRNAALAQAGAKAVARGLVILGDQSQFTVQASSMSGTWRYLSAVATSGGTPTVTASNLQFQGSVTNGLFTAGSGTPTFAINSGTVIGNLEASNNPGIAVINMASGGTVNIDGAQFSNNRLVLNASGAADYNVLVRNSLFAGNATCAQPTCYTFSLAGGAASVFDFGTAAAPGGNTFTAAATGTGLLVKASAGITVNAVGNTWTAGAQGANGSGQFVLGAAPCGPSTCSVATGAGRNYVVQSGALRLAGN